MKNMNNFENSASGCCLAFAWFFCQFQPGLAYKVSLVEKRNKIKKHVFANFKGFLTLTITCTKILCVTFSKEFNSSNSLHSH